MRRKVEAPELEQAARALEALPRTSEAMARGEISFSKVRALTRVATPESEAELLELARAASAAKLERVDGRCTPPAPASRSPTLRRRPLGPRFKS